MNKQRNLKKLWFAIAIIPVFLFAGCTDDTASDDNGYDNGNDAEIQVTYENINPITAAEILAAQTAWGDGLVAISTAYANGEDYGIIAQGVLDDLYGYGYGPVLFKPTIAQEVPFRFTEADAASYFIGGIHTEDGSGFATSPWTAVSFEDDWEFIINGETAIGMGTVILTDGDGGEVMVQKSMGWFRDTDGSLKIQLHHSSVPFS